MSEGIFPWPPFHNMILKIAFFLVVGPLTECEPNVDQEKWPCIEKMSVLVFFVIYVNKGGLDF